VAMVIDWSVFRSAPVCLLRDTGECVDANDEKTSAPPRGRILLSRALCRFHYVPPSEALSTREAEDAALLYAEAHAPFAQSDWMVVRAGGGFGVWWWDSDLVARLVGGLTPYRAGAFIPESLAHAPAEAWRQVRTVDGYEAQYSEGGVLRASQWRRRPFDRLQWQAFTQSVSSPAEPAPDEPPPPRAPSLSREPLQPGALVTRASPWRQVELAGWCAAALAVLVTMFMTGHAARYDAVARENRAVLAQMEGEARQSGDVAATERNVVIAREAAALAPSPDHLIAVADVVATMVNAGILPTRLDSDAEGVRVVGRGQSSLEDIGAILEANPRLRNVAPQREAGSMVISADLEVSARALADGAVTDETP
jgi:hypothetical protein